MGEKPSIVLDYRIPCEKVVPVKIETPMTLNDLRCPRQIDSDYDFFFIKKKIHEITLKCFFKSSINFCYNIFKCSSIKIKLTGYWIIRYFLLLQKRSTINKQWIRSIACCTGSTVRKKGTG